MMALGEKKMHPGEIWNSSQVFLGHNLSNYTGDLYILNSCLERLNLIKHTSTKKVFEDLLHLWTLIVIRNDEAISENQHGEVEKIISELCEKLTPEVLGILEAVSAD